MINQFALSKALLDRLELNTAIKVIKQGEKIQKDPGTDYLEEKEVPTSTEIPLGKGATRQQGFYQILVETPIEKGKWYNLNLVNEIMPIYPSGLSAGIEFDGQKVSIHTVTPSGIFTGESMTHLITALTINYTVIA